VRLYIDIDTGELRRELTGPVYTGILFYLRDIIAMEIVFIQDGAQVTTTVLAGPAVMKLGLRSRPGSATILALATTYTLAGQIASATFSLNTSALVDHFTSNIPAGSVDGAFVFEVEVTAADESRRRTYLQVAATVRRDVNQASDTNPPAVDTALYVLKGALFDGNGRAISPFYVAHRGEVTARTGGGSNALDGIVTTTLTVPFAALITIAGSGELWLLATGTDAEDGTFIVRPDDYDGTTNPRVWKRII
jgi:hypothetical protein